MKSSFFIIILFLFTWTLRSQAGESKEKVYLQDAARKAANENKLLVIEFWSPSCGPCMAMKRDIFENKMHVEFVHKYFSLLPISPMDSIYNSLFNYFHLEYQSSIVYLDKHGNEIDRTIGYSGDRDAYIGMMKDIVTSKNLYADVVTKYRSDTLNIQNCFLMAGKLTNRYEYEEAERLYNKILFSDPADKHGFRVECLFKIAEMEYIRTNDLKKIREFIDVVPKNPFASKAYVYLINDFISKKNKSECMAICEAGFNMYPDSWEILNKYAWAICTFKIQQEYPKALTMVQKSITLNPSRPGTYSTEAWIHFNMGDKEKAVELQKKAIALFPDRGFLQDLKTFEEK